MHRRNGFTLVEMMIVVAIITTLAALAIPSMRDAELKAKRAELDTVVDGIVMAEQAYLASEDAIYTLGSFVPDASPTKSARPWAGIDLLGFEPDGWVRGSYTIVANAGNYCSQWMGNVVACPGDVCVGGMTDVDGDGLRACRTSEDLVSSTLADPQKY